MRYKYYASIRTYSDRTIDVLDRINKLLHSKTHKITSPKLDVLSFEVCNKPQRRRLNNKNILKKMDSKYFQMCKTLSNTKIDGS